nr:unnamed protein product [Digitaria exilis]
MPARLPTNDGNGSDVPVHAIMHDATTIHYGKFILVVDGNWFHGPMYAILHDATTIRYGGPVLADDGNVFHGPVLAVLHDATGIDHRRLTLPSNNVATITMGYAAAVLFAENYDPRNDVTAMPLWLHVPHDADATV